MSKQEKYVIDSRYFSGYCITYMKDGIRSDFGGETLEELRIRENNPFLIAVSWSRIEKMLQIYQQGLEGPFKEITQNEYYNLMDVLPPLRLTTDSFFVGEPYCGSLYTFCFTRNNRYFQGLRSIKTERNELDRQIGRHMETISRNATLLKSDRIHSTGTNQDGIALMPYSFSLDGKHSLFICNLVMEKDHGQARTDMARTLRSLRSNHYLFYKGKGKYNTPDELIDYVSHKDFTLVSHGKFFQYPPNKESVTFIGQVKETGEEFLFRIYDREYFLYLLKRLRSVKRESGHKTLNIKA